MDCDPASQHRANMSPKAAVFYQGRARYWVRANGVPSPRVALPVLSPGPAERHQPKYPAVVYARMLPDQIEQTTFKSPLDVDRVMSPLPNHATRPITVQSGLFTVHNEPCHDWDDDQIQALLLNFDQKESRRATRRLLRLGFHRYALFPDLDGLSAHLSVLYTRDFSLQLADIAAPRDGEDERCRRQTLGQHCESQPEPASSPICTVQGRPASGA